MCLLRKMGFLIISTLDSKVKPLLHKSIQNIQYEPIYEYSTKVWPSKRDGEPAAQQYIFYVINVLPCPHSVPIALFTLISIF